MKVWTDGEWQQAKEDEEDGPFAYGPDAPADAAEANVEEVESHEQEFVRSDDTTDEDVAC